MLRGLDTTFLVQAEISEHPGHGPAKSQLESFISTGETLVLAPQVMAEFLHIVTDPRRFSKPLSMEDAAARADLWWHGKEVSHALPTSESVTLFLSWVKEHRLGRKRLLDTHLAATYFCHGVRSIVSSNVRDFQTFGCFEVLVP